MIRRNTQQQQLKCTDPEKFVNEMNTFGARLENKDFRK